MDILWNNFLKFVRHFGEYTSNPSILLNPTLNKILSLTRRSVKLNSIVFLDGKLHQQWAAPSTPFDETGSFERRTYAARSYVSNFPARRWRVLHADRNTRQLLFNLPLFTYESHIPDSLPLAFSYARPLTCAGIPVERTEQWNGRGDRQVDPNSVVRCSNNGNGGKISRNTPAPSLFQLNEFFHYSCNRENSIPPPFRRRSSLRDKNLRCNSLFVVLGCSKKVIKRRFPKVIAKILSLLL